MDKVGKIRKALVGRGREGDFNVHLGCDMGTFG